MAAEKPEARLIRKMKDAAKAEYGDSLVIVKYHGNAYSQSGVSDLLCCLFGVFVAAEVKAPESYDNDVDRAVNEGATPKQEEFLNAIVAAGGVAGVVASVAGFMTLLAEAEGMALDR